MYLSSTFILQCKNSHPPPPSTHKQGARSLPTQQVLLHQAILQRTWADWGSPSYDRIEHIFVLFCTYCLPDFWVVFFFFNFLKLTWFYLLKVLQEAIWGNDSKEMGEYTSFTTDLHRKCFSGQKLNRCSSSPDLNLCQKLVACFLTTGTESHTWRMAHLSLQLLVHRMALLSRYSWQLK